MKKLTLILGFSLVMLLSAFQTQSFAQTKKANPELDSLAKPYHPEADAHKDIDSLVVLAKKENKNIIIQAGGNWCIWCLRFNNFIHQNSKIANLLKDNFVYYHLNFSPENKNEVVFNKYAAGKGEEYGFPFFIVMDSNGQVLFTRESGSLESGKGYDETKVMTFFNEWLPKK